MADLTIAVPTYNRSGKLKECLGRLIRWSVKYPDLLIRVHDNASIDGTSEVVKLVAAEAPGRIMYHRHPENIGLVGNYISCIECSSTEYVWVMGDDDVIEERAIDSVMERLDARLGVGILGLNYRPVDGVTGRVIAEGALPVGISDRFPGSRDCFEACFREHYGSLMFITACVLRRDCAVNAIKEWVRPQENLAFPFYVAGACASSAGISIVDAVVFDGLYNVGSWKTRSLEVFHIELPKVLIGLVRNYGYGKGLVQPHLARFPGSLYKPSVALARQPVLWVRAIVLFRRLVQLHRAL